MVGNTSYKLQVYRFELVRDEKGKYRSRNRKKSRDRLKFTYERPNVSLEKQLEIKQGIQQAIRLGTDVNLLLFGYFHSQQLIGQIMKYEEEMEIILVRTAEKTDWIDVRDILEIDLDK